MTMTDMRAARFHSFGGPEVLQIDRIPIPRPAFDQVLVRVRAVSVNGGELFDRAGRASLLTGRAMPKQTGLDLVGTIVEVGDRAPSFTVGQRVWGLMSEKHGLTSAAEYAVIPADHLSAAPASLSDEEAVTLVAGGTTALRALRDEAKLQAGERLLVRGAAGGVGSLVVQLGVALGAHVTGLARPSSSEFVHELGADEVFDYSLPPAGLPRFDVIVDASTAGGYLPYRRQLARGGRFVALSLNLDHLARDLASMAWSAVYGRQRVRFFRGAPRTSMFQELADLADHGMIRPVVDTIVPLDRIADAHRRLEAGGVHGKLVVSIDRETRSPHESAY